MMRFAGDVIGYILKNPFTEGFQRAMDHVVIGPIERSVASDADLMARVPQMIAADTASNALPTERQIAALSVLNGEPIDAGALFGRVNSLVDEGIAPEAAYRGLANDLIKNNSLSREALQQAAAHVVQGDRGLTDMGDNVRNFLLGSPAAAYGTAAVGAGLLGYGGYNAYQQLQQSMQEQALANEAAQREEEKKKQAAARAGAAAGQGQG
jgi:hypothetical protein